MNIQEMNICLWFDNQAEEAAKFYTSIFDDSEIGQVARFGKEGFEHHGQPEGLAMTVNFTINKMKFIALNGGPHFKFNEAISIIVNCDTQDEIDHYWTEFTKEGQPGPCGWLKDKYGVSWQINPTVLSTYLSDKDLTRKSRVEKVMFQMSKFDIETLNKAYENL